MIAVRTFKRCPMNLVPIKSSELLDSETMSSVVGDHLTAMGHSSLQSPQLEEVPEAAGQHVCQCGLSLHAIRANGDGLLLTRQTGVAADIAAAMVLGRMVLPSSRRKATADGRF